MTDTSLEPIMTDLINEVFTKRVSLTDVIEHLLLLGGREFEGVSVQHLTTAVAQPRSKSLNWHDIAFGCDETLAYCHAVDTSPRKSAPVSDEELRRDACARLLAVGLLGEAAIQRECDIDDHLHLSKVLYTLTAYCGAPFGGGRIPHLPHDTHIERLAKYIFRQVTTQKP